MNLYELTAHELRGMLRNKDVSATEVTRSVVDRVRCVDDTVKAFMTTTPELALEAAARVDGIIAAGGFDGLGPLAGIPTALKDVLCTKGVRTTCSSKILGNFVPPYDATVVERLKASNFVMVGKTNMDEFAMGSSCENSRYFPTHNPWDLGCVPGGSSGGSAAAVASDMCIVALGSDTGGSIRQPASFCGIVGLKPTYGYVSRFGLIAFASSLDQIGPMTKDVTDSALVMNVIAGHDERDSTSAPVLRPDFTEFLTGDIRGMRIGLPKEYFIDGIDIEVRESVLASIKLMEDMGATVHEISLPHTGYAVSTYYIIGPAEASSNLARFDGVQYGLRDSTAKDIIGMYTRTRSEGFGDEAKRRILLGTYCLSAGYYDAYYLKALKVRTKIREDFDNAFKSCDCIVTPTSPTPAFKIGEKTDDPIAMYLSDVYTIPANLAGLPAMSIPCGFSSGGLPVGLQIMAKPFDEEMIFRVAYAFEQSTDFHKKRPRL